MKIARFSRYAAWTALGLIVLVTLAPIQIRPPDMTTTDLDRALAFVVMSALFVIAYPGRVPVVLTALFLSAFAIELTQFADATRHPHLHDALVKAVGVLVGVGGGLLANLLMRQHRQKTPSQGR